MTEIAARARIDGGDDDGPRRKPRASAGTRDTHFAVFEGLAQCLQGATAELRQLVEKQYAVVCQCHLTRARDVTAADEARFAHRVMRRAKWTRADHAARGI